MSIAFEEKLSFPNKSNLKMFYAYGPHFSALYYFVSFVDQLKILKDIS